MRKKVASAASMFAWLLLVCTIPARKMLAAGTDPLLTSWLASQTNIQAWSADVIQTRTLKALTQPLVATGHVWFAQPNRFHWEIREPTPTIAVRNADEMLVITPRLKRVERFPLTGHQTGPWRDTLALLEAGFPRSQSDLESRFQILGRAVTNRICELTLQPKSSAARRLMPQLRIAFATNDFSLRATELEFADGSRMRNDFANAELNPQLDEKLFSPPINKDFKIVEPLKRQP
jgi:outer membrane lipoprotein-sorting protein